MGSRAAEPEARARRRRSVLAAQGAYYVLLGAWPLAHFASFARAVALPVNPFQAHVFGAVLVVLGACLLEAVRREPPTAFPTLLGVSVAAAIAFVELVWLPQSRVQSVLWLDLIVQLAAAVALLLFYPRAPAQPERPGARRR